MSTNQRGGNNIEPTNAVARHDYRHIGNLAIGGNRQYRQSAIGNRAIAQSAIAQINPSCVLDFLRRPIPASDSHFSQQPTATSIIPRTSGRESSGAHSFASLSTAKNKWNCYPLWIMCKTQTSGRYINRIRRRQKGGCATANTTRGNRQAANSGKYHRGVFGFSIRTFCLWLAGAGLCAGFENDSKVCQMPDFLILRRVDGLNRVYGIGNDDFGADLSEKVRISIRESPCGYRNSALRIKESADCGVCDELLLRPITALINTQDIAPLHFRNIKVMLQ